MVYILVDGRSHCRANHTIVPRSYLRHPSRLTILHSQVCHPDVEKQAYSIAEQLYSNKLRVELESSELSHLPP